MTQFIARHKCNTTGHFVCDNNQDYLNNNDCDPVSNNNNTNNIQAIINTIIEVRMNSMFYILTKKKYILYLLIPKKKRSFHTSLFKIYLIDTFCDYVCVCDNDPVSFTNTTSTGTGTDDVSPKTKSGSNGSNDQDCVNSDCERTRSANLTLDTVVSDAYLASLLAKSANTTVVPVMDITNFSSSKNNFKFRIDLVLTSNFFGLLLCNDTDDDSSPNVLLLSSSLLLSLLSLSLSLPLLLSLLDKC